MTTIKLEVELVYDEKIMHDDSDEGRAWFFDLLRDDDLILMSSEIGDEVGTVKVTRVIPLENNP